MIQEVDEYNKLQTNGIIPTINPPSAIDYDESVPTKKRKKLDSKLQVNFERPLTAYSIFARQERQYVLSISNEGENETNLQSRMGMLFSSRWKHMSKEEKALYELQAACSVEQAVKKAKDN